ncbi:hypothetical protein [Sphingomonas sp. BK235]|uniref:hypothetical protein n=1 Tax=Sphingomonas sp. BK235 TaxID=2512131 RepID=UPI00104B6FBE|nr:hypothetical protein [Sphingomonas sp. BK235]TCP34764.1 putative repeat protein (TIGR01451 family) [Sphingomonas sp. BK235]
MAAGLRWSARMAVIAATMVSLAGAARAGTPAGTQIVNTARMTVAGDTPRAIDSNTVTVAVDAVVDVALVAEVASVALNAAATLPVAFTVTNRGNAPATYDLTAAVDAAGATVGAIVPDVDGDGRYDPAIDRGDAAVTLAPGASARVFVLVAGATVAGTVTATATARAGTGAPGTLLPAAGPAGSDAVVGTTSARASATSRLVAETAAARLDKAQSVVAPDGSTRAMVGSVVTYTLVARFARDCPAVEVSDAVPEGTRFVAGSITLDDQPVSDATDADPGRLDGAAVRVALGDMPAGATRTIRFKAIIL